MNGLDAVGAIIDLLNSRGVPYMVTGSLASNLYGVPRSTKDADFVVQLQGRSVDEIFAPLAGQFRVDPQMSFETVTGTIKHVLRTPDHALVIELFELSQDEHDQSRFGRRVIVRTMGRDTYVPTPEDVIITKLLWYQREHRSKDLNDARNVLATQQKRLDAAYLERWCRTHGTLDLLQQLREQIPPLA